MAKSSLKKSLALNFFKISRALYQAVGLPDCHYRILQNCHVVVRSSDSKKIDFPT
ncbi:hypothetical protein EMIT079MI2_20089 [Bacillus sp. IT-79MI2]